jgi:chemotaxis protein MotB
MRQGAVWMLAGLLGASAAGCAATDADWRERYLEKERDATDTAAQLGQERADKAAAVAQLEQAKGQIASLQREVDTLRSGAPVAAAPAAAPAGDRDAAALETVDQLKSSGLDAYVTAEGNVAIVLPADITFGAGSKELTPAGKKSVGQLAKELAGKFTGCTVRIEGHTDGDPIKKSNYKDNWELGSERALSVLRCLQADHGIAPERLVAASRGDTVPVADNGSDKGKARNRRVEVVVMVPRDASMAK